MDNQTIQFYHQNAHAIAATHRRAADGIERRFAQAFAPGGSVLDIGFGSGRDLKALIDAGYDGYGIEPCNQFIDSAIEYFPDLHGRVKKDALPALETIDENSYDGILCSAVLMHLPEELLFDSVYAIRRVLKEHGRLLISIPVDPTIANQRDPNGRLFNGVTPENFQLIFERIGFRMISRWNDPDSLGRGYRNWAVLLFVLESTTGSRSLDKIEGILNKDRKTATYKLALFRALAEIAMTNYNSAVWLSDGRVALALKSISEKWLEYYWPIVESNRFIPQKRGEKPSCRTPIAFRKLLNAVIECYRRNGGLAAFSEDYRNMNITGETMTVVSELIQTINNTIKKGPVYYSGGGGSKTFEYDNDLKSVIMAADIWRELSIMGSWIIDATILRWAELTAEISGGELRPSQIIDHLLVTPIPEREVSVARSLYAAMNGKVCVWSDRPIPKAFDVDHAIPFTLWKNNDLWNLLPADSNVNNQKRDKLPSHDLLVARKDCIVYYWTSMHENFTPRFKFEAAKFAGEPAIDSENWENKLFSALTEAVEITAIQRGVDRWQPVDFSTQVLRIEDNTANPRSRLDAKIIEFPTVEERFVTCVPFYELAATAGSFSLDQFVDNTTVTEHKDWIVVENKRLEADMFVIKVVGRSMEPKISNGDYCLFRSGDAIGGTKEGRIMLVQHHGISDPDTNWQFTVKRYHSEKVLDENGYPQHVSITLKPLNSDYDPILIEHLEEEELRIIGEFVSVIPPVEP